MILKNFSLVPELSGGLDGRGLAMELKDGKIAALCADTEPVAETAFDCGGRTLLPGFLDIHTHLNGLGRDRDADVNVPMKVLVTAAELARHYLDYGFTTIRDCGSIVRASIYTRELVQQGLIEGPRILACGQTVCPTEVSVSGSMLGMDSISDGPDEVRRHVRREFAEGADFIKIYASGSAFNPKGKPLQPIMMEDEVRMAVQVAAMKGSYVAAHAHCDSAIRLCVDTGVRTIEHATYLSEETLNALLKTNDCYLVPTLAAMYCNPGSDSPFWKERLGAMLEACGKNLRLAWDAGCKMGFGTDSIPAADKGQYREGVEFRYRRDYIGMSNLDILRQATRYSAEIVGLGDMIGQVRPGYEADLVLVSGDPVADLSVVYGKPDYVFQAGRLVRDNTKEA